MSVSVTNLITLFDTFLDDTSTDQISTAQRYQFLSEATVWLNEELQNEHAVVTYNVDYLDGVHRYKVTTSVADLLIGADLRRGEDLQYQAFSRKSPREIWEDIAQSSSESEWAIERYDDECYLVINHDSSNQRQLISDFDSETDGGGSWVADETTSDALNVTFDNNEYLKGTASLNFDVDVSQSGNNRATIYNASHNSQDLSSLENLGSFTFDVYIPDVSEFSSVTLKWSSGTGLTPATIANYWSVTATTDIDGEAFVNGWNKVKVDWEDATATGTPDATAIVYWEINLNYTGSQLDDTDFRLDNFAIAKAEKLVFHYVSYYVGRDNSGTDLITFTAGTDVPFFSGKYDNYKYAVAHKAASLAFYSPLRLTQEGAIEESEALKALKRYRNTFESSVTRESRNFKVFGINFRRKHQSSKARLR